MGVLRSLGEIAVFGCVHVVEKTGKLPVIGRVGDALHPAHEREGQHFITVAACHLRLDHHLFPIRYAGHHIGEVGRRKQEEVLNARVVMAGQVVDHLVGPQGVAGGRLILR